MLDRENRAFSARPFVLSGTIGSAQLVSSKSATAEAVSLGTPPAGSFLIGRAFQISDNFVGGSISAEALTVGPTSDPDAIVAALDLKAGTPDRWLPGTAGIEPAGPGFGGVELFATFTPTGDSHSHLTAGTLDYQLVFSNPDENAGG